MIRVFVLSSALFVACVLPAGAQVARPAVNTDPALATSAQVHKNAVDLVEAMGARGRLVANRDKMFDAGAEAMRKQDATLPSEFIEEWVRRMRASFNPDDYLNVMVKVYEAHFTAAELSLMVEAQKKLNASEQPVLPDALRTKLATENTSVQSEILGGCAQVGAKLGGDIGLQIQKEHPEWGKKASAPPVP